MQTSRLLLVTHGQTHQAPAEQEQDFRAAVYDLDNCWLRCLTSGVDNPCFVICTASRVLSQHATRVQAAAFRMNNGRCKAGYLCCGKVPQLRKVSHNAVTLQLAYYSEEAQARDAGVLAHPASAYITFQCPGAQATRDRCHHLAEDAWDWPLQLSPECCCSARLVADVAPPASRSGAHSNA